MKQFAKQGYPPVGADISFLQEEAGLDDTPDPNDPNSLSPMPLEQLLPQEDFSAFSYGGS